MSRNRAKSSFSTFGGVMKLIQTVLFGTTILLASPPPVVAHLGPEIVGGPLIAGLVAALLTAFPKMLAACLILPDDLRPGFAFYLGAGLSETAIAALSLFVAMAVGQKHGHTVLVSWLIMAAIYLVLGFFLNFALLVSKRRQNITRLAFLALLFVLPFPLLFPTLVWFFS